jgi:2'-5' RNA ligase
MTDVVHGQPRRARLFFALWPDDAVRQRVTAYRQAKGRPIPSENWHITLVFLGAVTPEQQAAVAAAADDVRAPPFRLRLDRLGGWRRAGIAWLGASHVPGALLGLYQQLQEAAHSAGIGIETRAYKPHLTLARNAPAIAPQAIEPIDWDITEFCLVESETRPEGARYVVRRRWPLQPPSEVGAGRADVE